MKGKKNYTAGAAGIIGIGGMISIILVICKLSGVIHWSWLWVLCPLWIPYAIALVVLIIVLIAAIVKVTGKAVDEELKKR